MANANGNPDAHSINLLSANRPSASSTRTESLYPAGALATHESGPKEPFLGMDQPSFIERIAARQEVIVGNSPVIPFMLQCCGLEPFGELET